MLAALCWREVRSKGVACDRTTGDLMMNWNEIGPGMGYGMGFGWLFGLLILVLLVFAIAALIKRRVSSCRR